MGVNPDAVSRLGKLYGGRFPSSPSSRSQKINYFNRLLGMRRGLFRFGFVQIFTGRQVGVFFKMLRLERFGNGVFAVEPFTEINELAALRTKRGELPGQPVAGLFAGRAFGWPHGYLVSVATVLRSVTTFTASSSEAPPSVRIFCTSASTVCCCAAERCELLKRAWTSRASLVCCAAVSFFWPATAVKRSSASFLTEVDEALLPCAAWDKLFSNEIFCVASGLSPGEWLNAAKSDCRPLTLFSVACIAGSIGATDAAAAADADGAPPEPLASLWIH